MKEFANGLRSLVPPQDGWSAFVVAPELAREPVFPTRRRLTCISKINNYGDHTDSVVRTDSGHVARSTIDAPSGAVARLQTVGVDKVMGDDARGIPPRGRPV